MNNSHQGFIKLPRSLLNDPLWEQLSLEHRFLFIKVLELCTYQDKKFDDHGVVIDLKPGQLCITERKLIEECGKGFTKNEIHRGLVKLKLYGFLNQEVNHRKNILTITHKDTYDQVCYSSEPGSEPNLNQSRTRNKKDKNINIEKEIYKEKAEAPYVASDLATKLLNRFSELLFSNLPEFRKEKFKRTKQQFEAAEKLLIRFPYEKLEVVMNHALRSGSFWLKHCHSMTYFEKKFETLNLQLIEDQNPTKFQHNITYKNGHDIKEIIDNYENETSLYEFIYETDKISFIPKVNGTPTTIKFYLPNCKEEVLRVLQKYKFPLKQSINH